MVRELMPSGRRKRQREAGVRRVSIVRCRVSRARSCARSCLEERRVTPDWAKIWRIAASKCRPRESGAGVKWVKGLNELHVGKEELRVRLVKAARARVGQSPPANWAMAKSGRQLSARRLKALAGKGGAPGWGGGEVSLVVRGRLRAGAGLTSG